ncbi:MAG TPA: ferrous iron transport protein A [Candidatus Onthomonas avicola]|nr:ferrous iron transport protein A [Candidatus Onthomonas avicola]
MSLSEGKIGSSYRVASICLPHDLEKRLEALGMTTGTSVSVLNSKSRGVLIVKVRGTRFALGRNITKNILVEAVA